MRQRVASDDYFDDQPIAVEGADFLGHKASVEEVSGLILSPGATTLGLFGPWGTGKSSVLELLKVSLKSRGIKPVTFDAWKYADEPLRRQILVTIAEAVSPKAVKDLKKRLYETTEEPVAPTLGGAGRKALWAAAIVLISTTLLTIVANVAQVLQAGPWNLATFLQLMVSSLSAGLAPFAVFSVAVGTAFEIYKALPWGKVNRPPVANERLDEELQRLLIETTGKKEFRPLVVIVDELDRCPSDRVADALELTRQFLSVPGCVTIIAADRDYLSRAWHAASRVDQEERPRDFDEYIDKVFKRQVHLPPVHPSKLSTLALNLATERGGLWSSLGDLERIVSTLVPSSVATPRRVKALLNHFVTQYHVAARRFLDHEGGEYLANRTVEFAKLCTIKIEFPRFYHQLVRAHRAASLTESVLTARQLTDDDLREAAHYSGLTEFLNDLATAQAAVRDGRGPVDPDEAEMQALVRYLDRTAGIPTGSHDLLFLEVPHETFGLEPGLAEEVFSDAMDDQADSILATLESDASQVALAVQYLASRLGEAIGVERANVAKTALLLLGDVDVPIEAASAQVLLGEITRLRVESRLTPYLAPGRVRCGVAAGDLSGAAHAINDGAVRGENDVHLDARVIASAFDPAASGLIKAEGLNYFFTSVVGTFAYVREEAEAAARKLAEAVAVDERLKSRFAPKPSAEEPDINTVAAEAVREFTDILGSSPDDNAWQFADLVVGWESPELAGAWADRFAETAALPEGRGIQFAKILELHGQDRRERISGILTRGGVSSPEDFEALCRVPATDGVGDERLWNQILSAVRFDMDHPEASIAGSWIEHAIDFEDPSTISFGIRRLAGIAKALGGAAQVKRLGSAVLGLAEAIEEEDDEYWDVLRVILDEQETVRLIGQDSTKAVASALVANQGVRPTCRSSLAVELSAIWGQRPPLPASEIARLSSSTDAVDKTTLCGFLRLNPLPADLLTVARSRRSISDTLGPIGPEFENALGRLPLEDAANILSEFLKLQWPKKPSMSVYRASQDAAQMVADKAIDLILASTTKQRSRRYAWQVLEAIAPLSERASVRLARGVAKNIRAGRVEEGKLLSTFTLLFAPCSLSAREDLRQALAGSMKKLSTAVDARMVKGAVAALLEQSKATERSA